MKTTTTRAIYQVVTTKTGKRLWRWVDTPYQDPLRGGQRCIGPFGAQLRADDFDVGTRAEISVRTTVTVLKQRRAR